MKFTISALTDVPEAFRSEYEERGGKFYLKTEGDFQPLVDANTKLTEFRDNNIALNRKVTETEANLKKFEGITPEAHNALKSKVTELEAAGIKNSGDVGEQIKAAVKAAVEPLEKTVREREVSEAAARAEVARTGLENQLREAGVKAGIDDRAMPDYINRGMQVFKLVDGKAAPRKGDAPIFSKTSPSEELSMDEWATSLNTEAPFLFKPSNGGGGGGNRQNSGFQGQKKIISSDPLEFGRNLEGIASGQVVVQQ